MESAIASSNNARNVEKEDEIIPLPKIQNSKSQLQEISLKNKITPTVSIEIEHVEDILEDSSASPNDSKGMYTYYICNQDLISSNYIFS